MAVDSERSFPLPAILAALFIAGIAHWPLLSTPPLVDEAPFLSGATTATGWLPGIQWLKLESRLFGGDLQQYRRLGLALEFAVFAILGCLLWRRRLLDSAAVFALLAYLLHPARTEVVVRLGCRPALIGELMCAGGLVLLTFARKPSIVAGALLTAAGAAGMPGAVWLAVPWLMIAGGFQNRRDVIAAAALVAGGFAGLVEAPLAAPTDSAAVALDVVARPWDTGLVQLPPADWWIPLGLLAVWWLVLAMGERRVWAFAAAMLLAAIAAPFLRPSRTDLGLLGEGITPDAFLPVVGVCLLASFWNRAHQWPWIALVGVSVVSGFVRVRDFESQERFMTRATELAPDNVSLHVLLGEVHLQRLGYTPPEQAHAWAERALRSADVALRTDHTSVKASALRAQALAFLGKDLEACQESDRLIDSGADPFLALLVRGRVEWAAGRPARALRYLRSARQRDQGGQAEVSYRWTLALCLENLQRLLTDQKTRELREFAGRLLEAAPEELGVRQAIAESHVIDGDLPRAVQEFESLLEAGRKVPGRPGAEVRARSLAALINLSDQLERGAEAERYRRELLELERRFGGLGE